MEHNDKDKSEAKNEQMNGQSEEAPQRTTTSEEPANANENDSQENEEISQNDADKNEEENPKEEEEEEDGVAELNQDGLQSAFNFQMDENNRPVCRYNTVCYRKIKRGNTKQRIDEFESILNV